MQVKESGPRGQIHYVVVIYSIGIDYLVDTRFLWTVLRLNLQLFCCFGDLTIALWIAEKGLDPLEKGLDLLEKGLGPFNQNRTHFRRGIDTLFIWLPQPVDAEKGLDPLIKTRPILEGVLIHYSWLQNTCHPRPNQNKKFVKNELFSIFTSSTHSS